MLVRGSSVSVVVLTCNRDVELRRTLAGIYEQQHVESIEVVVVDDSPSQSGQAPPLSGPGSPEDWAQTKLVDWTFEMGSPQRLRAKYENGMTYLYVPARLSVGAKRNLGVASASNDIIVHWDDDVCSAPPP